MTDLSSVSVSAGLFATRDAAVADLRAEDRLDLLALTARFEWAFDTRQMDALADTMTDDVVIDHIFGLAEGKPAVMKMLEDVVPFKGLRHQATNAVVFLDDEGRPAVTSYLMVVEVDGEDTTLKSVLPRILAHALVTDVFRQDDGRWHIMRRTFEQFRTQRDYVESDEAWKALEQTASERSSTSNVSQSKIQPPLPKET